MITATFFGFDGYPTGTVARYNRATKEWWLFYPAQSSVPTNYVIDSLPDALPPTLPTTPVPTPEVIAPTQPSTTAITPTRLSPSDVAVTPPTPTLPTTLVPTTLIKPTLIPISVKLPTPTLPAIPIETTVPTPPTVPPLLVSQPIVTLPIKMSRTLSGDDTLVPDAKVAGEESAPPAGVTVGPPIPVVDKGSSGAFYTKAWFWGVVGGAAVIGVGSYLMLRKK